MSAEGLLAEGEWWSGSLCAVGQLREECREDLAEGEKESRFIGFQRGESRAYGTIPFTRTMVRLEFFCSLVKALL